MDQKILVLGAGMVGSAIAVDLSKKYKVTSADVSEQALAALEKEHGIATRKVDLSDKATVSALIKDYDWIVGAVPGFMGFETVKTVIETGKNIVDISFFPEDPFLLDEVAKQHQVTAIVDCGVAPGLSNLLLGYHHHRMEVKNFVCYVGGLPLNPQPPYLYKAPFSPIDVIEEYTRPARLVENGKEVVKEALTEAEPVAFDGIGALEAFNSDGLRSLIHTIGAPNMKEKTLRYPGHLDAIKTLKATGLFGTDPVTVKGQRLRPIDLTTSLLFPLWKLEKGEPEFTVMRIIIEGEESDKKVKYTYDLYDEMDADTQTSSMARTTGYTCTAAVDLLIKGKFDRKGIIPPEYLGEDGAHFQDILQHLEERGIVFKKTVE